MTASVLMFALCGCGADAGAESVVETVAEVDLRRYQGRWYEIASYPQWFERGLTNVSAQYTLKDGYVEVLNSGLKDGVLKQKRGKAKVVPGSGNARLKVSFLWPFYGKYWIVDLDPDYTWAAVSNPGRSTLWILSRTPSMDAELYRTICGRLERKGFDTVRLVKMDQRDEGT